MDAHLSERQLHDRQVASRRITRQSKWPLVVRYARHDLPEQFQLPEIVVSTIPKCWRLDADQPSVFFAPSNES